MNSQSDLLLAVLGLRKIDIERFRDVFASEDGTRIEVYTRTGGGNREDYPNTTMRELDTWLDSQDDSYDCTYCTDTFAVPKEFVEDVKALRDILTNGIRPVFGQHLAATLRREPNERDIEAEACEAERAKLSRTAHFNANGHTFVPQNDSAMETALQLAEANDGNLRSFWGIMPLAINVKTNFYPFPNAPSEQLRESLTRVEVSYDFSWQIDRPYWEHCQKRFATKYPVTMARIDDQVKQHLKRKGR